MSEIDRDLEFIRLVRQRAGSLEAEYFKRFEMIVNQVQELAETMGVPNRRLRRRERNEFHRRTMEQFLDELRRENEEYSRFNWQQRWRASLQKEVLVKPGTVMSYLLRERVRVVAQCVAHELAIARR